MSEDYRLRKIAFVSDHEGTTIREVVFISLLFPLSLMIGSMLGIKPDIIHYICVVLPVIVTCMGVLDPTYVFGTLAAIAFIMVWNKLRTQHAPYLSVIVNGFNSSRKWYYVYCRSGLLVMTCICILAVDFKPFPRRLAKVETFGIGLMDTGPGLYIYIMGAVARPFQMQNNVMDQIRKVGIQFLALLVLGSGRVVAMKQTAYPEHVTEYGVHWNFFWTLAAISCFKVALPKDFRVTFLMAIIILTIYEVGLNNGLIDYIHAYERGSSFVKQNKEGILSLPGYVGLYFLSNSLNILVDYSSNKILNKDSSKVKWVDVVQLLLLVGSISFVLLGVTYGVMWITGVGVSRRACNVAYVLLMAALGMLLTTLFMIVCLLSEPQIWNYRFSKQLLLIFLAANVMTGMVNLSVDTLTVGNVWAIVVVGAYTLALYYIAYLVEKAVNIFCWRGGKELMCG
eukprot:TRINITY_DN1551_c0_g1_i4.p1 TRINITY_DN1551_c0_g1~~TRINITY_DN1551_c0_g1_i4.p1  ORF type:complete len:453 (-),score=24.79 TRINITY_DN1551_c0_g1_i4:427-1785(-)